MQTEKRFSPKTWLDVAPEPEPCKAIGSHASLECEANESVLALPQLGRVARRPKVELRRPRVRRVEVFGFSILQKNHLLFTRALIGATLLVPMIIFGLEMLYEKLDYIVPPMSLVIDASHLEAH